MSVLAAIGVALLALSGVALAMGGAIRWMGCFTPGTFGPACPMHDESYGFLPGIDQAVGAGHLLLAPALVLLLLGLGRWVLALLTLVPAAGFVLTGLDHLSPPGEAARQVEGLAVLVPVLAVIGIVLLVLERGRSRTGRVAAVGLIVLGLAHSLLGFFLLLMLSGSHDDTPGWFLVQGVLGVLAAGAIALELGRDRGERPPEGGPRLRGIPVRSLLGAGGGVALLLAGTWWAMAGAITWRSCLEAGPGRCTATSGEGVVELPEHLLPRGEIEPHTDIVLGTGIGLLALGLLLVLLAAGMRRQGRFGVLVAVTVVVAVLGARIARANRRWEDPLVFAEIGYGIGLVALGLVVLHVVGRGLGRPRREAGRVSPGAEASAARSAGSPRRGIPAPGAPGPAAR